MKEISEKTNTTNVVCNYFVHCNFVIGSEYFVLCMKQVRVAQNDFICYAVLDRSDSLTGAFIRALSLYCMLR